MIFNFFSWEFSHPASILHPRSRIDNFVGNNQSRIVVFCEGAQMSGAILVSDRIKHHCFLNFLPEFKKRRQIPSDGGPDLIFPECLPSLAVVLIDFHTEDRTVEAINMQLGEVQSKFKNSYAIILNCDEIKWNYIQLNLGSGLLRLLLCTDYINAVRKLMEIYAALKDSKKLQMQKDYFEREGRKQIDEGTARGIVMKSFAKLGIPHIDGQLILDGFPTISSIIGTDVEMLSLNSPADQSSINKISNFFGADTLPNKKK